MTYREDPMWLAWQDLAPKIYNKIYYETNPLVSKVNNSGHELIEKKFNPSTHFSKVLEVGAGTGYHFQFVQHSFDQYYMTDISPDLLNLAQEKYGHRKDIIYETQDATCLTYPDNSFDRLISVYNLEHLPQPFKVLNEWQRVVKPNGLISIAIPLDGGIAWRLGRHLSTRRAFAKEGLDLDYLIAREHINPGYNLLALIRHYFPKREEHFFPFRIKLGDINLVYSCSIYVA